MNYITNYNNDGTATLSKICSITNKEYKVTILKTKLHIWKEGKLIQEVFPEFPPEIREFMITGNTPAEQQIVFSAGEDILDFQEFYEVMYAYRIANAIDQTRVVQKFEEVKQFIRKHFKPIN